MVELRTRRTAEDMSTEIKARLEYLRTEIIAERISYGEIAELQGLSDHIDPDDVLLLEWAGVPEPMTRESVHEAVLSHLEALRDDNR